MDVSKVVCRPRCDDSTFGAELRKLHVQLPFRVKAEGQPSFRFRRDSVFLHSLPDDFSVPFVLSRSERMPPALQTPQVNKSKQNTKSSTPGPNRPLQVQNEATSRGTRTRSLRIQEIEVLYANHCASEARHSYLSLLRSHCTCFPEGSLSLAMGA